MILLNILLVRFFEFFVLKFCKGELEVEAPVQNFEVENNGHTIVAFVEEGTVR